MKNLNQKIQVIKKRKFYIKGKYSKCRFADGFNSRQMIMANKKFGQ